LRSSTGAVAPPGASDSLPGAGHRARITVQDAHIERTDVQVLSAGTNTMDGIGPSLETVEVMWDKGVDVSHHVGQQLTPQLLGLADAVFCMEQYHKEAILDMDPEAGPRVHLLRAFRNTAKVQDADIPDPIGCSKKVYEKVLELIQDGIGRVAAWLKEEKEKNGYCKMENCTGTTVYLQ